MLVSGRVGKFAPNQVDWRFCLVGWKKPIKLSRNMFHFFFGAVPMKTRNSQWISWMWQQILYIRRKKWISRCLVSPFFFQTFLFSPETHVFWLYQRTLVGKALQKELSWNGRSLAVRCQELESYMTSWRFQTVFTLIRDFSRDPQ